MFDEEKKITGETGNDTNSVSGENFVMYSMGETVGRSFDSEKQEGCEKKKEKRSFKKQLMRVAIFALVFGLLGGTAFYGANTAATRIFGDSGMEINQVMPLSGNASLLGKNESYSGSVVEVVENSMPSVVSITNKSVTEVRTFFGNYEMENESNGSGVIIGKNDTELLIVTNYHVVAGSSALSVVFSFDETQNDVEKGKIVSAIIKGYDSSKDIAIIAVNMADLDTDTKAKLKIALLGDSTNLKLGEPVVAIGNALGYGQSVTDGIISALDRSLSLKNSDGVQVTNKYIQTNAAINPGNSGGALLNMRGELIGINSAKVSSSSVEGMGYAIPISDAMPILEEIMSKKTRTEVAESERGFIGIKGGDVTSEDTMRYGMPIGVYVTDITQGAAADKAGIRVGNVITGLDGYSISSMAELQNRLKYYKHGETIKAKIEVLEGNEYIEKEVVLTLSDKRAAGIE